MTDDDVRGDARRGSPSTSHPGCAGAGGGHRNEPWLEAIHALTTALGMLVTIVCVLFGALLAVIVAGLGGPLWVAVGIGVAGVLILFHEHHDRSPGRRGSRD